MTFSPEDIQDTINRYTERFNQYGYSPKTLGWDKGKQMIRFEVLVSQIDLKNKSILDIGCGFGDLNKILRKKVGKNYEYYGLDVVPVLVEKARDLYGTDNIKFLLGDFLSYNFDRKFDFVIASGIFNFKFKQSDNYSFIEKVIEKAFSLSKEGVAFDFLSDWVDYRLPHTFHSSPDKILNIGRKFTRNMVLKYDYMPFEFCLILFKDDSFSEKDTVFNRFKK